MVACCTFRSSFHRHQTLCHDMYPWWSPQKPSPLQCKPLETPTRNSWTRPPEPHWAKGWTNPWCSQRLTLGTSRIWNETSAPPVKENRKFTNTEKYKGNKVSGLPLGYCCCVTDIQRFNLPVRSKELHADSFWTAIWSSHKDCQKLVVHEETPFSSQRSGSGWSLATHL